MSRLGRGFPNNALMRVSATKLPATFDVAGAGKALGGGTNETLSWTHTISGSIVIVGIQSHSTITNATCTASVGSTAMTEVSTNQYSTISGSATVYLFALLNPPQGSQTVTVTFGGGGTEYVAANSVSYQNIVSYGSPVTNSGSGTSLSQSVTGVPATGRIVQIFGTDYNGTNSIASYNQTSRWNQGAVSGTSGGALIGDAPGASTVNFTATAASAAWGSIALPLT